mgnify:CR=1 FL=1|tara:strand:- start:6109 stop:7308 length:1200 start_codon:yes stop_codon:yes gene_type:complete
MGWGHSPVFYGYRHPSVWKELGLIGDRLTFTNDETVTKLGLGYLSSVGKECAMDAAVRYTLLNAGENAEINAKQMLNQHTRLAALIEENIMADGWYRVDGECTRGWVVATDFRKLWKNGMCSGYEINNAHFPASCINTKEDLEGTHPYYSWNKSNTGGYYSGLQIASKDNLLETIPVLGNERMLANHLEDKVVLRAINKSLNRMVKSDKVVQVTAGRGRTFRWNAWQWLDDFRNRRLVTEAKQRKLGDVVNGWEYTKGNITTQYGVEVCDYAWEPVEPVIYWYVALNTQTNNVQLPYIFFNKEDAVAYKEQIDLAENAPQFPTVYKGVDGEKKPSLPYIFVVKKVVQGFHLKANTTIEEVQQPDTLYKRLMVGPKAVYNEYLDMSTNRYKFPKRLVNGK